MPSGGAWWEMVQKEKGVTRGGYCCKWCKGFWKGKMGSSRFLQITSGNVVLQMVLDEPPERLYNRWVKPHRVLQEAGFLLKWPSKTFWLIGPNSLMRDGFQCLHLTSLRSVIGLFSHRSLSTISQRSCLSE